MAQINCGVFPAFGPRRDAVRSRRTWARVFLLRKIMEAYEIFKTVVPIEPKSDLTPNKQNLYKWSRKTTQPRASPSSGQISCPSRYCSQHPTRRRQDKSFQERRPPQVLNFGQQSCDRSIPVHFYSSATDNCLRQEKCKSGKKTSRTSISAIGNQNGQIPRKI